MGEKVIQLSHCTARLSEVPLEPPQPHEVLTGSPPSWTVPLFDFFLSPHPLFVTKLCQGLEQRGDPHGGTLCVLIMVYACEPMCLSYALWL